MHNIDTVGTTQACLKNDSSLIEITITRQKAWQATAIFQALLGGEPIGRMEILWFRHEKGVYGTEPEAYPHTKLTQHGIGRYGRDANRRYPNMIYMFWLGSWKNTEIRGVGSALLQAALEEYAETSSFHLMLEAAFNSHAFYFQAKLRCVEEGYDDLIEKEIALAKREKRRPNTESLGNLLMYLPNEAISYWKEKIRQNPILNTTKTKQQEIQQIKTTLAFLPTSVLSTISAYHSGLA